MLVPRTKPPILSTPQRLCVLGATGSIGQSCLEIVRRNPEHFKVEALACGKNVESLLKLIQEFQPRLVCVADEEARTRVLHSNLMKPNQIFIGAEGQEALATSDQVDTVIAAIVGVAGLPGVLAGLGAGKKVCLANKESLVCAGELVRAALSESSGMIIPVDSEHSAIFQALQGSQSVEIDEVILTASGGPFLNTPLSDLEKITPDQAIKHPRWQMGPKISTDSATLVNKALELIEAHWLFGLPAGKIEVVIHPASIIHSAVRFVDGSILAQMGVPDMKGPIGYALSYPDVRLEKLTAKLDFGSLAELRFQPLDPEQFPAVGLGRQVVEAGKAAGAVFNLANEWAVAEFLKRKLGFMSIVPALSWALEMFADRNFNSLAELNDLEQEIFSALREKFGS